MGDLDGWPPAQKIRDLGTGEIRWRQDPPAPADFAQPSLRPLVALHPVAGELTLGDGAISISVGR
jgi:hypothetical protein